jgi:hypothetical protein
MRVRIRRFIKQNAVPLRWPFPRLVSETARPSGNVPQASPASHAHQYPYPGKSAFFARLANCSSYSASLMFSPSHLDGGGTMASADFCRLSLTSRSGLLLPQPGGRPPQVRTLTFPAPLPHLLLWPLVALGFAVSCQLARPHSLLWGSCSSSRRSASGFLQTPPHGDALAIG